MNFVVRDDGDTAGDWMMYEQYKKIDQVWLPHIPAQWKVEKIKHLFAERVEKGYPHELLLVSSQSMGVVPKSVYGNRTVEAQKDLHLLKLVRKGDFVISLRAFQGGIEYAYYQGIISPAYTIMVNKGNIVSPYFKYLAKSSVFIDLLRLCVTGIREGQNIDYNRLKNFKIPVPPRTEQDQIVRFLDWKVSAINRLIGINEKRRSMIQELVAKKFGDISSKATNYVKLKYISSLVNDFIEIEKNKYYIKTGMYNRGRGIFRREPIPGEDMGDSIFQRVHANCVMISGQFAWEAAVYITTRKDEIGVASHRYYLLDSGENLPPEYVWCFLMSDYGQLQMKMCSHGAAGRNRPLNINELLNVYIPLPDAISDVADLVNMVHKLMMLRENIDKSNQTLEELKTRLIADTVTGKIDVRNIEIPDYEFVGEESQTEKEIDADGIENEV